MVGGLAIVAISADAQEAKPEKQEANDRTQEQVEERTTVQPADSVLVHDLGEVVVEAQRDYIYGDKAVFKPSKQAKNMAFSAQTLLQTMAIPMLNISPANGAVTMADGQGVEIYIDYLPATGQDLAGLRPADVRQVEVLTNPTDPRFRGARNVVNFVLYQYKYGGYTKLDASQQFMETQGNYAVKSKLTTGRMTYDVAGSFNFSERHHSSDHTTTTYGFPDTPLTTESNTLESNLKNHGGIASIRAVYNSRKASISNTISYQANRNPGSFSRNMLTYSPAWYPAGVSENLSNSSSDGVGWNGDWFFVLPHRMTLIIAPMVSYGVTDNNTTFTNNGYDILNLGHEKSWETSLNARLSRMFGNQQFSLSLYGVNQGNSIRYEGTTPSKTLGRNQGGVIRLDANLRFGRLQAGGNVRFIYEHDTFGSQSTTWSHPAYYIYATYGFSQRSSLSFNSELSRWSIPMNQRNPEFVMQSLVSAVQGNPELKTSRYNSVNLFYTYLLSNQVSLSLFGAWNRLNDNISLYYTPEKVNGTPVIVQRMANKGFISRLHYGARASANLFNRSLTLQFAVMGDNDRVHSFADKSLDMLTLSANASYYLKGWYVRAHWETPNKYLSAEGITKGLAHYYLLSIGYGYNGLNIQVSADNFFNSSWKLSESHQWTTNYDSRSVNYGAGYHRSFTVNLSYSFGYGKRIERGNELEGGVNISSGLVN